MESVVRGHNWYFDAGNGSPLNCWRVLDEVELPEISFNTDDFAPGGHMMGVAWAEELQSLKATVKLRTDDASVRALCGRQPGDYITCTHYENLRSYRDGSERGRVITIKGLLNAVKADTRKGLKAAGTSYEFSTIVGYLDSYNGAAVHRFDLFAGPGATLVNGANPFAGMAANIAIVGGLAL
jgi:hypothetical protein